MTGLTAAQLGRLATSPGTLKVSQRDLAYSISQVGNKTERMNKGGTERALFWDSK